MRTLILGGVRSGKSRLAERLAMESRRTVTYVATAKPGDKEMLARIREHRRRRPPARSLVEEPVALAQTLAVLDSPDGLLLVDCLTLWLTNLLLLNDTDRMNQEMASLQEVLAALTGDLVMVSNETGLGVVPKGALSRNFCDEAGWLHQACAQVCDRVILTVAGLPQVLKGAL